MENKEIIETYDEGIGIFHNATGEKDVKEAEVYWRRYHENLLLLSGEERKVLFEEHMLWVLERLLDTTYHWIRFMDDLKIWGFLEEMDAIIAKVNKDEERSGQYPLADKLFMDCSCQFVLGNMELAWSLNNAGIMAEIKHYPTRLIRAMMYAREGEDKDAMMFYQILHEEYPDDILVNRAMVRVATRLNRPKGTITIGEMEKEEGKLE